MKNSQETTVIVQAENNDYYLEQHIEGVEMEKDKTEGYLTRKNQNYLDVGDNKKRYQG